MQAIRNILFGNTPEKEALPAVKEGDKEPASQSAPHSDQGPIRSSGSSMIHREDSSSSLHAFASAPPVPDHMSSTLPPLPKSAPPRLPGRSRSSTALPHQQHQNPNMIRARSLSKVFTQLPTHLPTITEIQVDVIEWYAYVLLLEQDRAKHVHYKQQLETCLQQLGSIKIPPYGRLFNRLQVTALCSDITCMKIELMMPAVCVEDDDDDRSNLDNEESKTETAANSPQEVPYSIAISPNDWDRMTEQLILVKSLLLRQDANTPVLPTTTSSEISHPRSAVQLDQTLAQHDMMTEQYNDVLQLLRVQKAIATLLQALQEMEKAAEHRVPTQKQRVRQLQQACSDYEQALKEEFKDETHGQGIPKELTKFFPKEEDAKKINVTESIRDQVYLLVLSLDGPFSHATLQNKMRALLQKWSESILDIPTLVKLGYGGVTSPVVEGVDGEDDVSSWGGSDDGHDVSALVDHSLASVSRRIRRSEAQRISVTEEERELMEHLNSSSDEAGPLLPVVHQQAQADTPVMARRYTAAKLPRRFPNHVAALASTSTKRDSVRFLEMPIVEFQALPPLATNIEAETQVEPEEVLGTQNSTGPAKRKRLESREIEDMNGVDDDDDDDWLMLKTKLKAKVTGSDQENREGSASASGLDSSGEETNFDDKNEKKTTPRKRPRQRRTSGAQRIPFSLDEVRAIRAGIRKFGIGHWAEMKAADPRLQNRTSVQIKDKYRTMVKRNEI